MFYPFFVHFPHSLNRLTISFMLYCFRVQFSTVRVSSIDRHSILFTNPYQLSTQTHTYVHASPTYSCTAKKVCVLFFHCFFSQKKSCANTIHDRAVQWEWNRLMCSYPEATDRLCMHRRLKFSKTFKGMDENTDLKFAHAIIKTLAGRTVITFISRCFFTYVAFRRFLRIAHTQLRFKK